ncbi:hypothetical protein CUMW_034350 [Citrus unshiu]|nr:hypothetical protein CUMW_034350 [Citrus unshiu]
MASTSPIFISATILLLLSSYAKASFILTLVNNCPFPVWPAIQPNAGHPVLERGGFYLHSLTHRSFPAPAQHWSGRIWARTGCTYAHGKFSCVRSPPGHGPVVACKSGCEAFGTDELCCRNHYNSPQTCRASSFSEFFKHACPATMTYAHDSPSLMHECSSPRELKVIFCH